MNAPVVADLEVNDALSYIFAQKLACAQFRGIFSLMSSVMLTCLCIMREGAVHGTGLGVVSAGQSVWMDEAEAIHVSDLVIPFGTLHGICLCLCTWQSSLGPS